MAARAPLDLRELTDSKLVYERRPPALGFAVIAAAVLAIVVALVWAATTVKPSVVQGVGTVEAANRTYVMSSVSGRVLDVVTPNGSTVEEGDVMIRVESADLSAEQQSVDAQIAALESAFELQQEFTQALASGVNGFDTADPAEAQYHYAFEAFEDQKAQLRVDPPSMQAMGYSDVEIINAQRSNDEKAREITNSALSESAGAAADLRRQIDDLRIRADALSVGGSTLTVVAAASGSVYLEPGLRPGTVISAGDPVGTIASSEAGLVVRAYVSVPDRELVSIGDRATVSVTGLPSVAYEKVEGTVTAIDTDVTTMAAAPTDAGGSSGSAMFGLTIDLSRYDVESRSGRQHPLGNGTAVRTELAYDEITYLQYLAQLIGFR